MAKKQTQRDFACKAIREQDHRQSKEETHPEEYFYHIIGMLSFMQDGVSTSAFESMVKG